jgi:hypothetical protein
MFPFAPELLKQVPVARWYSPTALPLVVQVGPSHSLQVLVHEAAVMSLSRQGVANGRMVGQ